MARQTTRRWVDGLRDIDRAAAALSRKTRVLSVMDREADCFAVFDEQRRLNRVEVLVRAHHDRCLAKGAPKLFAAMRAGAADGHVEIEIDRLSARRKSNGRQARPARTGRVARAEVRHRQVVAPPTIAGAEPVALSTVHVRETAPPPGEPAVEWFLLTSLDVDSTETAVAGTTFVSGETRSFIINKLQASHSPKTAQIRKTTANLGKDGLVSFTRRSARPIYQASTTVRLPNDCQTCPSAASTSLIGSASRAATSTDGASASVIGHPPVPHPRSQPCAPTAGSRRRLFWSCSPSVGEAPSGSRPPN